MNKLVSIIVPCYNQAQYLDEALQSVYDQTYQNWECIIVNDGSPDHTEEVAKRWLEKDLRFKYVYKENGGLSSARNLALENAKGDYIQFLDADDCIHDLKFEKSLEALKQGNTDLIITNYVSFIQDKKNIIPPRYKLLETNFNFESIVFKWDDEFVIPIHCALFSTKYFKNFRFSIELKAKEDWIMWIKIFQSEPRISFINKPYALYRDHQNSMTKDLKKMQFNYIKSLLYLKNVLNDNDFDRLMKQVLGKLYNDIEVSESNFRKIKKSKTYKWGSRLRDFIMIFNFKILFQNKTKS